MISEAINIVQTAQDETRNILPAENALAEQEIKAAGLKAIREEKEQVIDREKTL